MTEQLLRAKGWWKRLPPGRLSAQFSRFGLPLTGWCWFKWQDFTEDVEVYWQPKPSFFFGGSDFAVSTFLANRGGSCCCDFLKNINREPTISWSREGYHLHILYTYIIYIYILTNVYIYTHTYIYICTYVYTSVYSIHITYVYTYTHLYTYIIFLFPHIHTYVYIYIYIQTSAYVYICNYLYNYIPT